MALGVVMSEMQLFPKASSLHALLPTWIERLDEFDFTRASVQEEPDVA